MRASHIDKHPESAPPVKAGGQDVVLDRMNRLSDFNADLDRLVAPYMKHNQKAITNPLGR